jgi:hypothetical protein
MFASDLGGKDLHSHRASGSSSDQSTFLVGGAHFMADLPSCNMVSALPLVGGKILLTVSVPINAVLPRTQVSIQSTLHILDYSCS